MPGRFSAKVHIRGAIFMRPAIWSRAQEAIIEVGDYQAVIVARGAGDETSRDQITKMIEEELPDWKSGCEKQETETVFLTQQLGSSVKEMLLL